MKRNIFFSFVMYLLIGLLASTMLSDSDIYESNGGVPRLIITMGIIFMYIFSGITMQKIVPFLKEGISISISSLLAIFFWVILHKQLPIESGSTSTDFLNMGYTINIYPSIKPLYNTAFWLVLLLFPACLFEIGILLKIKISKQINWLRINTVLNSSIGISLLGLVISVFGGKQLTISIFASFLIMLSVFFYPVQNLYSEASA